MPKPRIVCPGCGHDFGIVRCQCEGHILSSVAWDKGRWDWRPLYGSFSDRVRPSDLDFIVERGGRFLVFETKGPTADVPHGQRRLLEALARIPNFTVATLWGDPDYVERIQLLGSGGDKWPRPIDNHELWAFAANWWTSVTRLRGQAL